MKLGSRRMILVAAGTTVVSLIGVAWATSGPQRAPRSSIDDFSRSNAQTGRGVDLPVCGPEAFAGSASQAAGQAGQAQGAPLSEDVFENVTVLTGIPVDEFMGTMGAFSAALSFCCSACHTGAGTGDADYVVDTPRKQTARRMVLMMSAINRANFGGRQVVTCWTCHRGGEVPATTATMADIYTVPTLGLGDVLVQAPGAPPADEILDKYIEALGGAARLATLTSFIARGTSVAFGAGDERRQIEVFAQAPGQRTTIMHSVEGDYTTTYDGRAGWVVTPYTPLPVMTLTGGELDGARVDAEMAFPGRVKEVLSDWRVSFPDFIDDRLVQVVQGGAEDEGALATLYFDDETGLLTRMVRHAPSAVGRVPTQYDYADYREVAGVMMPFSWTLSWVSGQDVVELSEVQPNVPIDAARFARPAPSAP